VKNKIAPLSEETAAKIAAGEVVERPASIVKELVENSLDAGASRIEVELEEGGVKLIRVVDDGEGIYADDVPLVFQRHTTSKISSIEDLDDLETLGFRGEAMYSIAAVSRIELLTRRRESTAGTRAIVEKGIVKEITEAGSPAGTSVRVTDLFYALPARRKFLKKTATERTRCAETVTQLALANPSVGFRLKADGRVMMNISKSLSMTDRLFMLWGEDFRKNSIVIDDRRGFIRLRGAISLPSLSRAGRQGILCFVNGRPLRDSLINRAIMSTYRGLIEPRRYPVAVLLLEVPGDEVDVNVHPTKLEVRFRDDRSIYSAVSSILAEALACQGMRAPSGAVFDLPRSPSPISSASSLLADSTATYNMDGETRRFYRRLRHEDVEQKNVSPFTESCPEKQEETAREAASEKRSFNNLQYLGQVAGTYLIFSGNEGLVIIDQHAAHERILFEKLKESKGKGDIGRQGLLIPEIISMSPASHTLFMNFLPLMEEMGFEIEPYGENTISVKAVPALFDGMEIRRLIEDTIDEVENTGAARGAYDEIREKFLAVMACRAAVMGGQLLSEKEVRALCADLDSISHPGTCPHGRPVWRVLDISELERMFKRK